MRIGCVILAAGEGSRLGGIPKALIKLNGKALIQRHIEALYQLNVSDIVVVTGHYADQIEASIKDFPVKIARNNNLQSEQGSSVRLGIETLGASFDLVLMMLSDQPLMDVQDVQELISVYQEDSTRQIILPMVNGMRGNPTVFSGKIIQEILETEGMVCRQYMDANPDKIFAYQTNNKHFVMDIDRIEDVENIKLISNIQLDLP
jgi:molybdenum cofactor cytidylyltransferase